jgi:AAA domain
MIYRSLYNVERFRPTKPLPTPANGRGTRCLPARARPSDEGTRAHIAVRKEDQVKIHQYVDLKTALKPLRYTIDGVVCRGRIYTLRGPTNAGKTTWCTMAALAVATGRSELLNLGVEKGRVLYLAIENPDDTISRFAIAQKFYGISDAKLKDQLFIVKSRATPEGVLTELEKLAASGRFALVIVDTLAAFFDGKDMNDNVEGGNFMRRLRHLTTVLGKPAVVVPAHPTKGADRAKLSPYGGGAIINEVDGNLTLWRKDDVFCTLHWQTKFRGPDFSPVLFRFGNFRCDEVVDSKGHRVSMPILLPVARESAPRTRRQPPPRRSVQLPRAQAGGAQPSPRDSSKKRLQRSTRSGALAPDAKLLRAMIADPNGTQSDWASTTCVAKSNVNRRLARLQLSGLVRGSRGRWRVTDEGKRTVRAERNR